MSKLTLNIDGRTVEFAAGQTILEVARSAGIHTIPTLCYLKDTTPTGSCRMCLVEVEGARTLLAACATAANPAMVIRTESPRVNASRQMGLELLLTSGNHNCKECEANGVCELQALGSRYLVTPIAMNLRWQVSRILQALGNRPAAATHHYDQFQDPTYYLEDSNEFIRRDFSRCIKCGRCVRACNEKQVNRAISVGYRGSHNKIVTRADSTYDHSDCVSCGECVQACPVGALVEKKSLGLAAWAWETQRVRTTCSHCSVGCQLWLHVKDDKIVKVTGVDDAAPNQGRLCVKGRFGYDFIYSPERLTTPLIKTNGEFRPASWNEALDLVAHKLKETITQHGPDAVAGVSGHRSSNEDSYQMQKLLRAVIGTNNIDHWPRSAPTVAGLTAAFGSGAMTNSFADFAKAKMFLVIGSDLTKVHPVAATFLKNAVQNGARLIVADPRRTKLSEFADIHVPIKVGSDVAFLNGLMHTLISEDLYDREYVERFCTGFEALKLRVQDYPPERAAAIAGISAALLLDVARRLAAIQPLMLIYAGGIADSPDGMANVLSCANLQMVLGNVGLAGGGVNPLPGRNNQQGACDMGTLPNLLPGQQKVDNPRARAEFEAAWGVNLPEKQGLVISQMLDGLANGKIRFFYVCGENLVSPESDLRNADRCLADAEFIVCQDIFPTETTRLADVVLPAAAWSEADGTFTSSERRVSRVRQVSQPPGQARPNWWIFKELAKRLGHDWASNRAQEIWDNEISRLAPALAGINYHRLEAEGLQWPVPHLDHPGTALLHQDGFISRVGRFIPVDWTPPGQPVEENLLAQSKEVFGFAVPTYTFLHRGHTWVVLEDGGRVRIGMDDFSQKLLGPGDKIRLPEIGAAIRHDEAALALCRQGEQAGVLAPLDGIVEAVNRQVLARPDLVHDDPYGQGWLLIVNPTNLKPDLESLYVGEDNAAWIEAESHKLLGMLEPSVGATLHSGGAFIDDVYGNCPQLGWARLVKEFLRSA